MLLASCLLLLLDQLNLVVVAAAFKWMEEAVLLQTAIFSMVGIVTSSRNLSSPIPNEEGEEEEEEAREIKGEKWKVVPCVLQQHASALSYFLPKMLQPRVNKCYLRGRFARKQISYRNNRAFETLSANGNSCHKKTFWPAIECF